MLIARGRGWESAYRDRWRHDKVVRSTHGVNCTGSCSWNVYVKDGLITWESQAVDYPRTDPDRPNHEPRGCPRGASFSWYTYSPARLKYPYVRGSLLELWRAARASAPDPIAALRPWLAPAAEARQAWPPQPSLPAELPVHPDVLARLGRAGGWITAVSSDGKHVTAVRPAE